MLKRKNVWLLLSTSLVLTACTSSVAGVEKDRVSTEEKKEELVIALNGIQEQESAVQQAFTEALSSDPELASFQDGSAPIFDNIETRKEQLETMKDSMADLLSLREELSKYDEEELPQEQIAGLLTSVDEIASVLEPYVSAYESQLQQEEEIFRSFGEEDADFNAFYEGVEKLNETSESNLDALQPLNELLPVFDERADKLETQLSEMQED